MGDIHITKYCCLVTKSCLTLFHPVDCSPAGVSCHFLLQGIFPTKGSNTSGHCRWIPYHWATRQVLTEYHSSIKWGKALIQARRRMNPENVTQSERSQTWKTTCGMILLIRNVQNRQIYRDKWRSVVTGAGRLGGYGVNRYGVPFRNDENNIKLWWWLHISVNTLKIWTVYFKRVNFMTCELQLKGMTEMAGWHHWLDGPEFEQAPGVGDG